MIATLFQFKASARTLSRPLVSVVIPTFNRESTIIASIESVRNQTFKDLEIIVVDDGSTDDSEKVIKELACPNLEYIRHPTNLGANIARNTGIKAAQGQYIAFQDSDDLWHPEKLNEQLHACRDYNSEVTFCAFSRFKDGFKTVIPKPAYNIQAGFHDMQTDILRGSFISCQTLLVSKKALLKVGSFDENLPRLQDWDLCIRLSKHYSFFFIEQVLVDTEVGPSSISSGVSNYSVAAKIILEKYRERYINDRTAAAMLCVNVAIDALRKLNYRCFASFSWRALSQGRQYFPFAILLLLKRR